MNIILPELDPEQATALESLVADHNASSDQSLSADEYCSLVLMGVINDGKRRAIEGRRDALFAAVTALPDNKRLEFTQRATAIVIELSQP
jgi:hypothetical protein